MEESFICQDCAIDDAKEYEVDSDIADDEVDCEFGDDEVVCGFGGVEEYELESCGYGGDHCIVSDGDTIDEDLCHNDTTQLEHSDHGYEAEVEESLICQDSAFDDANEHEVESYDADVEDLLYYCDANVEDLLYY